MRRRTITKRELTPDVKYNSELVARLINTLMRMGKKSVAQKIVYNAFDSIKAKKKDMEPLEVFIHAVENVKPKLEVKSRQLAVLPIRFLWKFPMNARQLWRSVGSQPILRQRKVNPWWMPLLLNCSMHLTIPVLL